MCTSIMSLALPLNKRSLAYTVLNGTVPFIRYEAFITEGSLSPMPIPSSSMIFLTGNVSTILVDSVAL